MTSLHACNVCNCRMIETFTQGIASKMPTGVILYRLMRWGIQTQSADRYGIKRMCQKVRKFNLVTVDCIVQVCLAHYYYFLRHIIRRHLVREADEDTLLRLGCLFLVAAVIVRELHSGWRERQCHDVAREALARPEPVVGAVQQVQYTQHTVTLVEPEAQTR